MSKIAIAGNASGAAVFTIASPSTGTDRTLTLPDNTGTIISTGSTFAGTGPAFSAFVVSQTIGSSVATKATLSTELFDTNSNFDPTTNYRFTPTVGGYYQVNANVTAAAALAAGGVFLVILYKNGSQYGSYLHETLNTNLTGIAGSGSVLVEMNGSSDYLELYLFQSTGMNQSMNSYFSGSLARAA